MSKHLALQAGAFTYPVRVYYQDTDAGGVVYHATYIHFLERARIEWLRGLGYDLARLERELGVLFMVRALQFDFLKPARLDDLLTITAQAVELGRSRVAVSQHVVRRNVDTSDDVSDENEVMGHAVVNLVCVDSQTYRPVSIPDALRHLFVVPAVEKVLA